jgi:hypothetical protein
VSLTWVSKVDLGISLRISVRWFRTIFDRESSNIVTATSFRFRNQWSRFYDDRCVPKSFQQCFRGSNSVCVVLRVVRFTQVVPSLPLQSKCQSLRYGNDEYNPSIWPLFWPIPQNRSLISKPTKLLAASLLTNSSTTIEYYLYLLCRTSHFHLCRIHICKRSYVPTLSII